MDLFVIGVLLFIAALVINRLLCDVSELKSDLSNLTHVHTAGKPARRELKVGLTNEFDHDKLFKYTDVFLVKLFFERV